MNYTETTARAELALGPTSETQFRNVLVPHLFATLRISWKRPPNVVSAILAAQPELKRRDNEPDLVARCGVDTVETIRALAAAKTAPSFTDMQDVQRLIIKDQHVDFRSCAALAPTRLERYSYFQSLPDLFRKKVEADFVDECHPVIKAV